MAQVSKYPVSASIYQRVLEIFFKTLVEIKTEDEAKQFIEDFLTPTEQVMLAKRLATAFLLEKEYEYRTISQLLRVSLPTIASVNVMRKYGGQGYQKMIKKLLKEEAINDFLLKTGEFLSGIGGQGGKGSDAWRYLHQELRKRRKDKPF